MNNEHEMQLRRLAMRISLDLAILNRHDALAVITMAHGLTDHFLHPLHGRNDLGLGDLEKLATCRAGAK